MSVDPAYKVARSGARAEWTKEKDRAVIDGILGIDVSKNALDVSISSGNNVRRKTFMNSSDGWRHLLEWMIAQKIGHAHACLESTGRYSLGIACALYDAGHVVSIVNPAQIRDFARTKLGRNKTDQVDASHIREFCELFKPKPWAPPSEAHRRLGELQTIRSGIIAGLTEWKNRKNSGITDAVAKTLAEATISHFTSQLAAVDKAIALTIDNDSELRSKRDLLLSIDGVGEILAGVVLAELPGPDVLRSSTEVVAYAGLNPRQHRSGTSIDRVTRISKIGNAILRAALYMPALSAMRYNPAIAALVARLKCQGRLAPKQIVVAAMRKLLVLCFGVLKTGKRFDTAIAMGQRATSEH
jgi:transposase